MLQSSVHPYEKPVGGVADWKMPYFSSAARMQVALNFSTEVICWLEKDFSFLCPLVILVRANVVVHNMAAAPAPEFPRLQQIQSVISHLVVGDYDWSHARKSFARLVHGYGQVCALSAISLIRDTCQHPEVVIQAESRNNVNHVVSFKPDTKDACKMSNYKQS